MFSRRLSAYLVPFAMLACTLPLRAENHPATQPAANKMAHVDVDIQKKQVRVECDQVNAQMPLEFFCCATNTQEHETVLRTLAKASHIHMGLLMLGLQPGEPVHYIEAEKKWMPPKGAPLSISCEFEKDNKTVVVPAYRMMRNVKNKKEMPPCHWVFTGSRLNEDGYAADMTGYTVTVVNFDMALIDVPELASSSNEKLEWEYNPDLCPKKGSKVTMIIEPAREDK